MDINRIREQIQTTSDRTEMIFTELGASFPSMLSLNRNAGGSSIPAIKNAIQNLVSGFSGTSAEERGFFRNYNVKSNEIFAKLNERMTTLDELNRRVSEIRADSEELEIISLNAMVISIKSGEKGRAFSTITENLKRLSARMITLSNDLMQNEQRLLEQNGTLKRSFNELVSTQEDFLRDSGDRGASVLGSLIGSASEYLTVMDEKAGKINAPIRDAMAGVQLQDIVRQSIDQVHLALAEIQGIPDSGTVEEKLDQVTLDLDLFEVSCRILRDVKAHIERSLEVFAGNWDLVHGILDSVEEMRRQFITDFLDGNDPSSSIPAAMRAITGDFSDYIARLNLYQRGQRSLVRDSAGIIAGVKHLRSVFDTIKPIISRLQHVRITQQIEVAKNPAIAAVKDTVEHMSELIMKADERVQTTRKELEGFIGSIEELTGEFTRSSDEAQRELERIKQDKIQFFSRMNDHQEEMTAHLYALKVYPDSFGETCRKIDGVLEELKAALKSVEDASEMLSRSESEHREIRNRLLSEIGESEWTIHNDHLRLLAERFTITSHKEAAGEIGGFDVEGVTLDKIESGDVTLFF